MDSTTFSQQSFDSNHSVRALKRWKRVKGPPESFFFFSLPRRQTSFFFPFPLFHLPRKSMPYHLTSHGLSVNNKQKLFLLCLESSKTSSLQLFTQVQSIRIEIPSHIHMESSKISIQRGSIFRFFNFSLEYYFYIHLTPIKPN